MIRFARFIFTVVFVCAFALPAKAQSTTRPGEFDETSIRRTGNSATTSGQPKDIKPMPALDTARVVGALAIVIGLIFIFRWGAKKYLGFAPKGTTNRSVKVIGRTMISPRQHVVLLQVGRRVIVAADNAGQLSALAQLTDADEVAELLGQMPDEPAVKKPFSKMFGKAEEKYDDEPDPKESDSDQPAPALVAARDELGGLMEKVRQISQQMQK